MLCYSYIAEWKIINYITVTVSVFAGMFRFLSSANFSPNSEIPGRDDPPTKKTNAKISRGPRRLRHGGVSRYGRRRVMHNAVGIKPRNIVFRDGKLEMGPRQLINDEHRAQVLGNEFSASASVERHTVRTPSSPPCLLARQLRLPVSGKNGKMQCDILMDFHARL